MKRSRASSHEDVRLLRVAGGTVLAIVTLIWLIRAVAQMVDVVPGNLSVLSDPARPWDTGDARRGIAVTAIGFVIPAVGLALAIGILRGSRKATLTAIPGLILLVMFGALSLHHQTGMWKAAPVTSLGAALVVLGYSLVIEVRLRRAGISV